MKKKFKLGVLGAGFMATAIINGAISNKVLKSKEICVYDIDENARERIKKTGVSVAENTDFLFNNAEFVLFAIKPQNFYESKESFSSFSGVKVISIMAGVKIAKIKSAIKDSFVARAMPNTPCSLSSGAVGLDVSDFTDKEDANFVKSLFSSLGYVALLKESDLNTVTGISGSSPAYFYMFVKGLIDSAVKRGLSYEDAKNLIVNTMIGSGKMILKNSDKNIDDLIKAVCSKGGTTIQAVNVFENEKLSEIEEKAVDACVKRSIELENL